MVRRPAGHTRRQNEQGWEWETKSFQRQRAEACVLQTGVFRFVNGSFALRSLSGASREAHGEPCQQLSPALACKAHGNRAAGKPAPVLVRGCFKESVQLSAPGAREWAGRRHCEKNWQTETEQAKGMRAQGTVPLRPGGEFQLLHGAGRQLQSTDSGRARSLFASTSSANTATNSWRTARGEEPTMTATS